MKARTLSIGSLASIVVVLGLAVLAHASVSAKVIKAFKGQILVSQGTLQGGDTDAATIAAYKSQRIDKIRGTENGDGVQEWTFHYTAFLKKKGSTDLTLRFYKADDSYCADQHLSGVDKTATVIEMDLSITEDDGPSKNKDYILKLVDGDENVVASTKLRLE